MERLTIRRTIILNDLHKYLIGTAAGIVLCLLIWGGISLVFGGRETNNVSISRTERDRGAFGTASGRSSDILGNNGSFVPETESDELTPEQQERLLAAQVANESLAKKYGGQDGSGVENGQSFSDNPMSGIETYPGVFGDDALAFNRGTREQAAGNQQLEEARNTVRDYIIQGKSAAQKNQLANALTAFDRADEAMPNDKDFEAASYHDRASSLFLLSKTAPDAQTVQNARDQAERYIKKSLAARDNTDARQLYSNIIAEHQKEAEAKRQQALLAQQQAVEHARSEERTEQQRKQVIELIGQGKNAVNKRQLNNAVSAFDKAASSMPDNKQFASDSYTEMADSMLNLAQHTANTNDVHTSLNKAESYVKEALAAQNSSNARNLYAKILDVRKEQERLAQERAEAQRKQQEQANQAAAQKKAEEQRKEQERLAQERAEAQRKQQEQASKLPHRKKRKSNGKNRSGLHRQRPKRNASSRNRRSKLPHRKKRKSNGRSRSVSRRQRPKRSANSRNRQIKLPPRKKRKNSAKNRSRLLKLPLRKKTKNSVNSRSNLKQLHTNR